MDPVEPNIHSFIVKVWQEVVVGDADEQGWRGYITHVPSGTRRYFEDLAEILAFVQPTLAVEAIALMPSHDEHPPETELPDDMDRVARRVGDVAPGPEEVEMDSSSSGLDALLEQQKQGNETVDEAATEAADAQARLKQARETQAALQKAIDQLKASTTAIDKAVAAAINPKAAAEKIRADIAKALDAQLTDEQRAAVTNVVKDADDRHSTLVATRSTAAKHADAAQRDADTAAAASRAAAAELAAAHAALKEHGASIQAVTVRVTALAASAKAAVDGKRPGAAFRLNDDLETALGRLGELTDPHHLTELQQQVAAAWTEVGDKATAASTAADAVLVKTTALQEADAAVKADDAAREASIDQAIAALEQQWGAKPSSSKPPAGAAQTTAATVQSSDSSEATA